MSLADRIIKRLGGLPEREARERLDTLQADATALSIELAAVKRNRKKELTSGPDMNNGEYRYEVARELRGKTKWDTLAKMESDSHVSGAVQGVVMPLLCADWEIKPASDDPRDIEIAEFVSANLLRKSTDNFGREYWCQSSWKAQRLPEILQMLWHGFAMFGKTWRAVEDKQVYDRLVWLEPSSVDPQGWKLSNNDELIEVLRTYRKPGGSAESQEPVSAEDIALYVWDMRGARFTGTPFVRAMYGPWMRKDFVLRQALIWAQKVGSPVPAGYYPPNYDQADILRFEEFVRTLRGTSPTHAHFVGPTNADGKEPTVHYVGAEGVEVDRMRGLINGENAEIAHAGASKSQLLGETSSGSRAVGTVQQDRETLMVRAVADVVCEWETHGVGSLPGLIEELVERNYSNVQAMPSLVVSKIAADEGFEHFDQLMTAIEKGVVPRHKDVSRQVTAMFGIELPDEVYEEAEEQRKQEAEAAQEQLAKQEGAAPAAEDDSRSELERRSAAHFRLTGIIAGRVQCAQPDAPQRSGYRRELTAFESLYVQVAQVSASFVDGERKVYGVLRRAARAFVDDILARGRSGKITEDTAANLRRSKPRKDSEMKSALRAAFVSIAHDGKTQSEDEIQRQTGQRLEAVPPGAQIPRGKTKIPPKLQTESVIDVLLAELADESRISAELSVDGIWQRLVNEGLGEWDRLRREGLDGEELWQRLDAFLDDLSDRPLADAARQISTVAVNQGRDIAAKMALVSGAADWAIRSEVLDQATCEECTRLDDTRVRIGSAEYEALMPPARCDGGDRCRGFYFVLTGAVVGEE